MADLESVLADVSYLMAMEKSKAAAKSAYKKFALPDISVHCAVARYLKDHDKLNFKSIYNQDMGRHFFTLFCGGSHNLLQFLEQVISVPSQLVTGSSPGDELLNGSVIEFEKTGTEKKRQGLARRIYDTHLMPDLLANESLFTKEFTDEIAATFKANSYPQYIFRKIKKELISLVEGSKFKEFLKSPEFARYCQWKYIELNIPHHMSLNDFSVHRIIGRGGFGEVYGCRKDDSGRMFALKCLDKKRLKLKKGEDVAINERNILMRVSSPFIVNMYYCFQSSAKLFFVLDLMNGGDLHYHLSQRGVFNEEDARFYMCEIMLGLEHLHGNNIVYRDLKPSNILLDEEGHVRISDLGLAFDFVKEHHGSAVGTHGYMAPEVITKGVNYTYTADWFSFGCVCYKLVVGHSPFRPHGTQSREDIDKLTLEKEVTLPSSMSAELKEVINGLLKKNHKERFGCRGRGSHELKDCTFFKTIDWDSAKDKKLKPPLIPPKGEVNAADTFDIGSFNDDDVKGIKLTDEDEERYERFNTVIGAHWQFEMMDSIFEVVNTARDKEEAKERQKYIKAHVDFYSPALTNGDCILQGQGQKLNTTALISHWNNKYMKLYPNRIEWADSCLAMGKGGGVAYAFDLEVLVREVIVKGSKCIQIQKIGERKEHQFKFESMIEHIVWLKQLRETTQLAAKTVSGATRIQAAGSDLIVPRAHRGLQASASTPAVMQQQQ